MKVNYYEPVEHFKTDEEIDGFFIIVHSAHFLNEEAVGVRSRADALEEFLQSQQSYKHKAQRQRVKRRDSNNNGRKWSIT